MTFADKYRRALFKAISLGLINTDATQEDIQAATENVMKLVMKMGQSAINTGAKDPDTLIASLEATLDDFTLES